MNTSFGSSVVKITRDMYRPSYIERLQADLKSTVYNVKRTSSLLQVDKHYNSEKNLFCIDMPEPLRITIPSYGLSVIIPNLKVIVEDDNKRSQKDIHNIATEWINKIANNP
ncbi:hypothetical protein [Desulfosporosinus sp.]|uniref:hypothetical protein n=1 Tax=Desulfosporosinus sp. TaxID=157907 RepID=UPI0025C5CAD0|nr:hypothetical protein [Desulfosporosinus sp.]MBC2722047.1 hypothetical protein [Desulfosporosinus sp.]MBC2728030.1 hypothetical protein [Desulfosporosinus sp.]